MIFHNLMLKPISPVFIGLMDRIIQKIKNILTHFAYCCIIIATTRKVYEKEGENNMTDNEKLEALKKVIEKLEDSINLNKSRKEWIAWDKVLADIEKIINN